MSSMHLFFVPDSCGGFRRLENTLDLEEDLPDVSISVKDYSGEVSWELNTDPKESCNGKEA